jgi:hypothetical protein
MMVSYANKVTHVDIKGRVKRQEGIVLTERERNVVGENKYSSVVLGRSDGKRGILTALGTYFEVSNLGYNTNGRLRKYFRSGQSWLRGGEKWENTPISNRRQRI